MWEFWQSEFETQITVDESNERLAIILLSTILVNIVIPESYLIIHDKLTVETFTKIERFQHCASDL